ncbi:MAG: PAS-domain containing protein [Holosporales bacterium]|nr:PAS-domain containing protein [Holosporales bacterium]
MEFDSDDPRRLLLDALRCINVAFAAWEDGGSKVCISDSLKSILKSNDTSNLLDPYVFVRLINQNFGNFLNIAVNEVSKSDADAAEYSSTTRLGSGSSISLKLVFHPKGQMYILAAEHLKKSDDENLNGIIDAVPIYIWQRNRDLQITYCNKKYADALETTKDAVIASNLQLFSGSKADVKYVDRNNCLSQPKRGCEHVIIKGKRRLLDITETPFVGCHPSIGFALDVTDNESLQDEYKNYRKQIDETLDNISIPIAIFDKNTELIFANSAITKLFGMEASYVYYGKSFSEILDVLFNNGAIMSPSEDDHYKEKVLNLFSDIIEPYLTTIHIKNGRTMNVSISPNHGGGLIFIFEDISDKIALEREVHSLSAVQQETLDNLKEGVIVFGSDLRIKMTNAAINEIWNKKDGDRAFGTNVKDFIVSSSELFSSDGEVERLISKFVGMVAQRMDFSDTIALINGKTINYNYIPLPYGLHLLRFSDTTDKASLEKALQEKTVIVSQIDKLKFNLISNISFELRAPLNTIIGFTEILEKQYFGELNDKQLEYCHGITGSVKRLVEVVDAVINLASIEAGQLKLNYNEVFLTKFIDDLMALFDARARSLDIILRTDFTDEHISVFMDENSMKQAMFHILSLNVKLTPASGEIVISAEFPVEDSEYFYLVVSNNKIMISEGDLDRIEESLKIDLINGQIDSSSEFGIVLANNIIKLHEGNLSIISDRGNKVIIKCRLPIANRSPSQPPHI